MRAHAREHEIDLLLEGWQRHHPRAPRLDRSSPKRPPLFLRLGNVGDSRLLVADVAEERLGGLHDTARTSSSRG
jgi:hypothetical protein